MKTKNTKRCPSCNTAKRPQAFASRDPEGRCRLCFNRAKAQAKLAARATPIDGVTSLTVTELAVALGCPVHAIYQMLSPRASSGRPPASPSPAPPPFFRLGRAYRFPLDGVRQWIAAQTKSPLGE